MWKVVLIAMWLGMAATVVYREHESAKKVATLEDRLMETETIALIWKNVAIACSSEKERMSF